MQVLLAVAGVPNTTITMYNDTNDEMNLEANPPKDLNKAHVAIARRRIMNDCKVEYNKDSKGKVTKVRTPYASEATLFPV